MEGQYDTHPEAGRSSELEPADALARWRAMLSALSLYAPAAPVRAHAAAALHDVALLHPETVAPYAADLADALYAEERRIRWDALAALGLVGESDPAALLPVREDLTVVLYRTDSSAMQVLALRLLTLMACSSPEAAALVWPLLDEALLMLRGDPLYPLVLSAVVAVIGGADEDTSHLWEVAQLDAGDRRARVRVLAWRLRELLRAR